ncbi:hypothetical protein WDW89_01530 [Deltaproteobacteria bacterium TL4]
MAKENKEPQATPPRKGAAKGIKKEEDKGKGGGDIARLELPEKFKNETRFFISRESTEREEREMGVFFKMIDIIVYGKLRITLEQFQAMIKQNKITEEALDQHLRHYIKRGPKEAYTHLKVIASMLIEQSREPGQSMGTQVVLLFKAIDCLRMGIQYSDNGVDNMASFMILQVMARMPKAFVHHMSREKEIFNQNVAMQRALKEKLPTINVRNRLASLYLKQKCYADSLFHYEKMLDYFHAKKPMTPQNSEKICVLHLNIGDMLKDIYSFNGEFKNGQIFQNFLFRYNRDAEILYKHRTPITPLSGPVNKMTIKKQFTELQQLAVGHYEIALKFFPAEKNRMKRSEILVIIGKNYAEMGKFAEAAFRLQDSLLLLGKERNSKPVFEQKSTVVELMKQCVVKLGTSPKGEKIRSFVLQESNKLDADKQEWDEAEKKKEEFRKQAEDGGRRKIL